MKIFIIFLVKPSTNEGSANLKEYFYPLSYSVKENLKDKNIKVTHTCNVLGTVHVEMGDTRYVELIKSWSGVENVIENFGGTSIR